MTDEAVLKSTQARIFVQHQGSSPANPYDYVGCMSLDGLEHDLGTGEPILCPSSEVRGQYDIIDESSPPPSAPTTGFTQRMNRYLRDFWWDLRKRGCRFNLAIVTSDCARPDDPDVFDGKILVKGSRLTNFTTGAFNSLGEDAAVDLTGSLQLRDFDRFVSLGFGQVADTSVTVEALDGIFADKVQCGDCGTPSDGCQKAYVLTLNEEGEPGTEAQIVYSIDGGGSWASDEIDSLTGDPARRIAQVGRYIVAVSEADEAHHYKLQASIDAGTLGGWTRVDTGYEAGGGPRAIWSKSPSQTYVVGAGGYIYFMHKPTSPVTVLSDGSVTSQDLNDVRGFGRTIVAVGDAGAIMASSNGGRAWALVSDPTSGANILTVEVISPSLWMIGADDGTAWFTIDAGATWSQMDVAAGADAVHMIRMVDDIVGYMAVEIGGEGYIFRTGDNGYSWHTDGTSYLSGVPEAAHYNFVAPCPGNYNVTLAGGVAEDSDGVVALGVG